MCHDILEVGEVEEGDKQDDDDGVDDDKVVEVSEDDKQVKFWHRISSMVSLEVRSGHPNMLGLKASFTRPQVQKKLVQIFYNAGHAISYKDVVQVDIALAKTTLMTMNEDGIMIPSN